MRSYLLAVALLLAPAAAQAGDLLPAQAHKIEFRGVEGVAYYTVAADGQYRVVAVLGSGPAVTPVRFSATLLPGQSFTIAVPGGLDERDSVIEIVRQGDVIAVSPTLIASN